MESSTQISIYRQEFFFFARGWYGVRKVAKRHSSVAVFDNKLPFSQLEGILATHNSLYLNSWLEEVGWFRAVRCCLDLMIFIASEHLFLWHKPPSFFKCYLVVKLFIIKSISENLRVIHNLIYFLRAKLNFTYCIEL